MKRMNSARTSARSGPRRALLLATGLALAGLLAACASLIGPRQFEVSQQRLQEGLAKRMPLHQRVLAVFDVELSHPQLEIPADNGRIVLTLDATVTPLLARRSWHATMTLSGRLLVDPARNAVMISDARVERFASDGMDEGRANQLASAANLISDRLVREMPLYTFKPEDLRYGGMQFAVGSVGSRPGALLVTLVPAQ